jgi:hypothetical protein
MVLWAIKRVYDVVAGEVFGGKASSRINYVASDFPTFVPDLNTLILIPISPI